MLLLGDKIRNIYEVSQDSYNKLLLDNVTNLYQQSSHATVDQVNGEANAIATQLGIADRVDRLAEQKAFITLKDHKDNYKNNPKCRLINPAKSEIGKICKQILDPINTAVRSHLGLQQWQSTNQVLDWFKGISNKGRKRFLQLDIVNFYPSITEDLLNKALDFASTVPDAQPLLTSENINIIRHSRKSFLFTHNPNSPKSSTPWTKKSGLFDVTMGASDGAEICELVGLFLISQINEKFPELDFGLYRDDGIAAHRRIPGPRLDRIRKDLIALFKKYGLDITIAIDLQIVDFLDVTLDLVKEKFSPYRKPNDTPLYVHCESNHPPTVLKQVPISINKRLCNISSDESDFNAEKHIYQAALDASGYKHELKYHKEDSPPPPLQKTKKQETHPMVQPTI